MKSDKSSQLPNNKSLMDNLLIHNIIIDPNKGDSLMKLLTTILITNSIGILIIYLSYKFFSWLLIEGDPFLNPVKKDQSHHKPNFFARENEKLAEKDLKDQNKFTLTEVSKML